MCFLKRWVLVVMILLIIAIGGFQVYKASEGLVLVVG